MHKKFLIVFFLVTLLFSCKGEINSESDSDRGFTIGGITYEVLSCEGVRNKVEKCLGISQGSLNYIEKCGEKSRLDIAKMNSCEEVLKYIKGQE